MLLLKLAYEYGFKKKRIIVINATNMVLKKLLN